MVKLIDPARPCPRSCGTVTVTVPFVVWITGAYGWRAAFLFTGATGFAWVAAWLLLYPSDANRPTMTRSEGDAVADAAEAGGIPSFGSLLTSSSR